MVSYVASHETRFVATLNVCTENVHLFNFLWVELSGNDFHGIDNLILKDEMPRGSLFVLTVYLDTYIF